MENAMKEYRMMERWRDGEIEGERPRAFRFFSPSLILSISLSFIPLPQGTAHLQAGTASARNNALKIICVGDVMLSHTLKDVINEKGTRYPFERLKPLLQAGDVVFGNLENPIATRGEGPYPDKTYHFLMDPRRTSLFREAGFHVFSLANNHIMDYGANALL
jgi:poly-gamma-glutamate capsule biosynthesis protein CapA/YwtB (metallophosphatase superfamily)